MPSARWDPRLKSGSSFGKAAESAVADESDSDEVPDDAVLCPDMDPGNYCDCQGDCTENPSLCSCSEAQSCCSTFDGGKADESAVADDKACEDDDVAAILLA